MTAPKSPHVPSTLDCITCGLCIPTCPTWQQTGRESQSPRGRVHLMRAHQEQRLSLDAVFAKEMDDCLVCRRCESVCPAGVSFGALMEDTREQLVQAGHRQEPSVRFLLDQVLHRKRLHLGMGLLHWAQRTRLVRYLGSIARAMPTVPPKAERAPLPDFAGAHSPRVGEVWLLEGCVMPELFGRVHRDTLRLLQRVGYDVRIPKPRLCCGALHAHAGEGATARELARGWVRLLEEVGAPDAIISNSAGCGAHLSELPRILRSDPEFRERAAALSDLVVDAAAFLGRTENLNRLRPLLGPLPPDWLPLAYDDPCHLCHGQQVRTQPRALLDAIPGVLRVDLNEAEACCGSAGLYSLAHPEAAAQQLASKLVDFEQSGAKTLVTANPGCQMQWDQGLRNQAPKRPVRHLMEVLAAALR